MKNSTLHLHPEHDLPEHVNDAIRLLGRKWALIVLHTLFHQPSSFGELKEKISGISASVLSSLLSEFTSMNMLQKRATSSQSFTYFVEDFGSVVCDLVDLLDEFGRALHSKRPVVK